MLHRHCLDDPLLIKFSGIYIYTRIGPIVLWICNLSRFWLSCLGPLVILLPKIYLNYLVFQPFDLERRWWRSFQKRVLCTKLDIYVFIKETFYRHIYLSFCFYLFIYFIFCFMFIYLVFFFFFNTNWNFFCKSILQKRCQSLQRNVYNGLNQNPWTPNRFRWSKWLLFLYRWTNWIPQTVHFNLVKRWRHWAIIVIFKWHAISLKLHCVYAGRNIIMYIYI